MSSKSKSPTCVLCVSADFVVRQDAVRHLTPHGFAVWCVDTPEVAAEHMSELVPDVVLVDMAAASQNAAGFIAFMRAEPELTDVPVILLTRDHTLADDDIARDMGAARFLTVPIRGLRLRRCINSAVNQHKLVARAVRILAERGVREDWARRQLLDERGASVRVPTRLAAHSTPF